MSLLTQAYLLEKYGPRLTVAQLAEVVGSAEQTIYNKCAKGTFPVLTYVDGGKRFADYRDVAKYLDDCRERARIQA